MIYRRNTKNSSTYFFPSGAINVLCAGSGRGGSRVIPRWYTGFLEEELPSPPHPPHPLSPVVIAIIILINIIIIRASTLLPRIIPTRLRRLPRCLRCLRLHRRCPLLRCLRLHQRCPLLRCLRLHRRC